MTKTKKILLSVFGVFALVLTTACTAVDTDADEVGLHYEGGSYSAKKFKECYDPSTHDRVGPGDKIYLYPVGQRTFSFTGKAGSESDPIAVKTKTVGINNTVAGYVTFTLNTDCKTIRKFHETVGKKYGAYGEDSGAFSGGKLPDGWVKFLNDYIQVPLDSTMDTIGRTYDPYVLSASPEAQDEFEQKVKAELPRAIEAALGSQYIKVNSVQIKTPELPESLRASLEATEAAKLDKQRQDERNKVAKSAYQQYADCKKVLSESACITLKLAEDGKIPVWIVPKGENLHFEGFDK